MDRHQPQYTNYNPNTSRTAMNFTAKADPLGAFQSGRVGGLAKTAALAALSYFTGGAGGSLGASAAASMGAGAAGQALGSALGSSMAGSLSTGNGLQGMKGGLLGIGLEGAGGLLSGESLGDVGSGMVDSYVAQNTQPPGSGPMDGFNKLKDMATDPVGNWEDIANVASGGKYGQVRGLIDDASAGNWSGVANAATGGQFGAAQKVGDAVSGGKATGAIDQYMNRAGASSLNASSSLDGPTAGKGVGIMDAKTLNDMGGGIGVTAGSDIAPGDVGPLMEGPVTGELKQGGPGPSAWGPIKDEVNGLIDGLDGGVGKGLLNQSVYEESPSWQPINPYETSGVQDTYGKWSQPHTQYGGYNYGQPVGLLHQQQY